VIFRFWGLTPKPTPQVSIDMGEFVGLVETVATRYYSTPYVGGKKCKVGLPPKLRTPISRKLAVRFRRNFADF